MSMHSISVPPSARPHAVTDSLQAAQAGHPQMGHPQMAHPQVEAGPIVPPGWAYDAEAVSAIERIGIPSSVGLRDNRDAQRPCLIRFLDEADLDDLDRLNQLVLSRLPHPHILRPASRDYLARNIRERGRCIGTFVGQEMIAFTVLTVPRDEPDNLGFDMGFERDQRLRSCHFELSGVNPDFRGNHLHRTMNELRSAWAGAAGYYHLYGTVSPRNPYSLTNHFAGGFVIRKLVTKYGGMDRYIIHRDFRRQRLLSPAALAAAETRPCLDIESQKKLLAAGYWGVAVNMTEGDSWQVTYVPGSKVTFQDVPAATSCLLQPMGVTQ